VQRRLLILPMAKVQVEPFLTVWTATTPRTIELPEMAHNIQAE